MSNLRSDSRALVAHLPPGDVIRAHVERLCFQVDDVEERWRQAESALRVWMKDCEKLRAAIREHRDEGEDNRCWIDDYKLYQALGEPVPENVTALPMTEEFRESCRRFEERRRCPLDKYPPGRMTIAELEAEVERLTSGPISVNDRPPDIDQVVIVHPNDGEHITARYGSDDGPPWFRPLCEGQAVGTVTHWQALPESPR
jgi:hypothetical protein